MASVALLPGLLFCATEPGSTEPSTDFTITGVWGTSHHTGDIAIWYFERQDSAGPGSACHVWMGFMAPGRAGAYDNPGIDLRAHLLRFSECPPNGEQSLPIGAYDWGNVGGSFESAERFIPIDSGSLTFGIFGSFLTGTVDVWTKSDSVTPTMRMQGRFVAAMQPCPGC
jgi:hypothetical protein